MRYFAGLMLSSFAATSMAAPTDVEVLNHYADIAQATYGDSLSTAQTLDEKIKALIESPSSAALSEAKAAWLAARVPYQQSEVFRFGNSIVDEWEGRVNAWPLDEGLIDYVDSSYGGASDENPYAGLNVIANQSILIGGREIDATNITPSLLSENLHELDEIESNVAIGYHAIEFLLWGQDLNGHNPGAGQRSYKDFVTGSGCSNGHCDRRGDYLLALSSLLQSDLEWMVSQWGSDGAARQTLLDNPAAGIAAIFTGMGSLSYGEQAGERMKLGLMLNDPEEEHDCFADNTHNSHFYDGLGIRNVYTGEYLRVDGTTLQGPSVSDLVKAKNQALDNTLRGDLDHSVNQLLRLKMAAESGFSYDMMLERGNKAGETLIMNAVDGLVAQTRSIENAVAALGLSVGEFEGSDSLDNPQAVFQ